MNSMWPEDVADKIAENVSKVGVFDPNYNQWARLHIFKGIWYLRPRHYIQKDITEMLKNSGFKFEDQIFVKKVIKSLEVHPLIFKDDWSIVVKNENNDVRGEGVFQDTIMFEKSLNKKSIEGIFETIHYSFKTDEGMYGIGDIATRTVKETAKFTSKSYILRVFTDTNESILSTLIDMELVIDSLNHQIKEIRELKPSIDYLNLN